VRALGSIAIDQREIRGHKVVVWISPGWPVKSGEIGFDEATELSTRLRDPDMPLIRSQIMVEYGPQELGGKTYICPRRSVEVSRGRSVRVLHDWGMVFSLYSYFETMINDVTFGGYHKFGSEARILPGFEEPEENKTPTAPRKPN
jgi:hypothetical protein